MLALLVLVPIIALMLLNLPWRTMPRAVITASVLCLAFLELFAAVTLPLLMSLSPLPFIDQLHFDLVGDDLTRIMLATIAMVLAGAMVVGQESVQSPSQYRNFASLLLVGLTGMNAIVTLSDFFSLYLFLEVTAVSSFILIAMNRELFAIEGAFRYLLLSALASTFMLAASAVLLLAASATSFESVRVALSSGGHLASLATLGLAIFTIGLFIKGGLVPFHGWLPGAYASAPAPVSILLSGAVTKVSGIYALIRMTHSVYVPDAKLSMVLLVFGSISIIVGAVSALTQTNIKRMLAYSSISQVGYIVLALGAGGKLAVVAAGLHLFNHAVFKSLLFVNAAAIEAQAGSSDLAQLTGVGSKMPVTSATATVAMLSAAGLPPFAGFFSKLLIVIALVQGDHLGFAIVAVLASLLTLGYFANLQRQAFFGNPSQLLAHVTEANAGYLAPAIVLSLVTLLVGLFFPYLLDTSFSFLLLSRPLPF